MTPEQLRQAIDYAKQNPDDPRAQELRKRIESGVFNKELESLGMRTFEIKPPQIDESAIDLSAAMAGVPAGPGPQSVVPEGKTGLPAAGEDIAAAGRGLASDLQQRAENIKEILRTDQTGPESIRDLPDKLGRGFQVAGQIAGGAVDVAMRGVQGVATAAAPESLERNIERAVGDLFDTAAGQAAAEALASGVEAYQRFKAQNPEFAANLEAAYNIAELMGLGVVTRAARPVVEAGLEAAEAGVRAAPSVAREAVGVAADVTEAAIETGRRAVTPSPEVVTQRIETAVGRIIQGTPQDIAAGRRALQQIDTEGVQTYAELNERITQNVSELARRVDTELDKVEGVFKTDDLVTTTKVGDEVVSQDFVADALDGLERAYNLSGEAPNAARIGQLRTKLETDGLALREINDLAREYGIEFRDRAFTKLGEPKQGFQAENFENVRKGVKTTVRDRIPEGDTLTIELDKQITDLLSTRVLTRKMETNVQKLFQKVQNRTLTQKVGGVAADIVDLASFGTLRGFVQKLLPSNVGLKTANSLDLEKELSQNLKKIEKLNQIEDPDAFAKAFEAYIEDVEDVANQK